MAGHVDLHTADRVRGCEDHAIDQSPEARDGLFADLGRVIARQRQIERLQLAVEGEIVHGAEPRKAPRYYCSIDLNRAALVLMYDRRGISSG